MAKNKATVARDYVPKHSHLFVQSSKLGVKTIGDMKKLSDDIFTFPLFEEDLCDNLVEELNHFKDSGMPHSRPNSMNK